MPFHHRPRRVSVVRDGVESEYWTHTAFRSLLTAAQDAGTGYSSLRHRSKSTNA